MEKTIALAEYSCMINCDENRDTILIFFSTLLQSFLWYIIIQILYIEVNHEN